MKIILSISGGGMRGIIPCVIIQELEKRLGKVSRWCDLIAGTSTGGILACLLASGESSNKILDFYNISGKKIFKESLSKKLSSGFGVIGTKYSNKILREELIKYLGNNKLLSDSLIPLMVTTLTDLGDAEMIKSWSDSWKNISMVDAAMATSAAQTYFPHAEINGMGYLDGGNVRNNPSVCAAVEAFRLFGTSEHILLLSLGTGIPTKKEKLPNGGVAGWATRIFSVLTDADSSYDDYSCRVLEEIVPKFDYKSIDVALPQMPALDDASDKTLKYLYGAGKEAQKVVPQIVEYIEKARNI